MKLVTMLAACDSGKCISPNTYVIRLFPTAAIAIISNAWIPAAGIHLINKTRNPRTRKNRANQTIASKDVALNQDRRRERSHTNLGRRRRLSCRHASGGRMACLSSQQRPQRQQQPWSPLWNLAWTRYPSFTLLYSSLQLALVNTTPSYSDLCSLTSSVSSLCPPTLLL